MKQINPNKLTYKGNLNYNVGVKFIYNNELIDRAELLKTNGIAEEVYLKKFPEKPYTWIANVISIGIGSLNNIPVGTIARTQYEKSGQVFIPDIVKHLPLAEANSMLPEIHRRVWKNTLPHQEILCKYCGQKAVVEIELDELKFDAEDLQKLEENSGAYEYLYVDLTESLSLTDWVRSMKREKEMSELIDVGFNRLVFRIPTLADAIKHERFATTDSIKFWRKIAFECLTNIQAVSIDPENPTAPARIDMEVPTDSFVWLGEALMNKYLDSEDLAQIRYALREEIPTLPFAYEDLCPHCNRNTPYIMEASAFFSE